MGKRTRQDDATSDLRKPSKKLRHDATAGKAQVEEIITARQLQNLVVFQQDQAYLVTSINAFKTFLSSILHPENEDDVPRRKAILREYLDSQKPRNLETETEYLPDLMQSWNFAQTNNSDNLSSAVASAIDQLLKLLSTDLELKEHGQLLCRTLLQQAQLRILSRGVSAPKNKEHIIGPCLRILREVVTFDGGMFARQVYAKRDLALDPRAISQCLMYRRADAEESEDIVKRPSLRTTAIRYVLANFRFQDDGAKADMLKQGSMLRALIDGIESDHPRIISEVLQTLLRDVIQDPGIPRRNKEILFYDKNLLGLCQLYRANVAYSEADSEGRKPLMDQVHDFMVTACTSPEAGVIRASGWYPPTNDDEGPNTRSSTDSGIDLGLDGIEWYNKFAKHIPIRNQTLGDLILSLRPFAYDMERQLLVAILQAAPELVAWFYRKLVNYSFAPKLTATWIGYAAALFETVQLPVPALFSRMSHIPPPVAIMIENVLPAPLDQETLRQCLTSKIANNSDLIRLFAVRLLVASFQKLRDVLTLLKEKAALNGRLWDEAAARLVEEFCHRCPTLQDLVKLYGTLRNASQRKFMQREATSRLLALYYEVLPQVALENSFDVSATLANALQEIQETSDAGEGDVSHLRLLELSHLVRIARRSPSVHWMAKTKALKFSPLVTLLRLLARSQHGAAKDIQELVAGILRDGDAVQTNSGDSKPSSLTQLVTSLRLVEGEKGLQDESIYTFLDRCFHRYSTRPIKVEDDMDAFMTTTATPASVPCSLICIVILEQYSYISEHKESIGRWINVFFRLMENTAEPLARAIRKSDVFETSGLAGCDDMSREPQGVLGRAIAQAISATHRTDQLQPPTASDEAGPVPDHSHDELALESSSFAPPAEPQDHPILTRFRKKDLAILIEDGSLSSLISILSSPHLSLRLQALTALRSTMTALLSSTHLEKDTIYLLLGELLETCSLPEVSINDKPLNGLAVVFCARAVDVLKDPTHALYIKVNNFLNRGPSWRIQSMPSWWLERVLLHPPGDMDSDGSYWREVVWVLEWFLDGLRANDEFDIMRRNSVFEKCMALFFHPSLDRRRFVELTLSRDALGREQGLQSKVRPLICRILARAACVEGSTILITGMGVLAWFGDVETVFAGDQRAITVLRGLKDMVVEKADRERIKDWSGGALS